MKFRIFEIYRRPPDPVKFLGEEVGSKSDSCDRDITQYLKWNLQYLIFYRGAVEALVKYRI